MLPKCALRRRRALARSLPLGARSARRRRSRRDRILPIVTETARVDVRPRQLRRRRHRGSSACSGAARTSPPTSARRGNRGRGRPLRPALRARALAVPARRGRRAGVPADRRGLHEFPRCRRASRPRRSRPLRNGFGAKAAIHPDQVDVINEAFTPGPDEVAHARRVVRIFEENGATGVAALDGKMLDRPHLVLAQRILGRAEAATGS